MSLSPLEFTLSQNQTKPRLTTLTLRTRSSRAFFILLCAIIIGGVAVWHSQEHYTWPTESYCWTQDENGRMHDLKIKMPIINCELGLKAYWRGSLLDEM